MIAKNGESRIDKGLNTIIGPGCVIRGDITVEGGLRIDGSVTGKIVARGPLTVGREGNIVAPTVEVSSATIGGYIEGNITAPERIHLEPSARIKGNLVTGVLVIEEGARFVGQSNDIEDE